MLEERARKAGPPPNVAPRPKEVKCSRHFIILNAALPCDAARFVDVLTYALDSRFLAPSMVLWLQNNGVWPQSAEPTDIAVAATGVTEIWRKKVAQAHSGLVELFATERSALYVLARPTKANVTFAARNAHATASRDVLGTTVVSTDTWVFSGPLAANADSPGFAYVLEDAVVALAQWSENFDIASPLVHRSCINATVSDALRLTFPAQELGANVRIGAEGSAIGPDAAVEAIAGRLTRHLEQSASMQRLLRDAESDPRAGLPSYVAELIERSEPSDWCSVVAGASSPLGGGGSRSHAGSPFGSAADLRASAARAAAATTVGGLSDASLLAAAAAVRAEARDSVRRLQRGSTMQTKELMHRVSEVVAAGVRFRLPLAAFESEVAVKHAIEVQWQAKLSRTEADLAVALIREVPSAVGLTLSSLPSSTTTAHADPAQSDATATRHSLVPRRFVTATATAALGTSATGARPPVLGTRVRFSFFKCDTNCVLVESSKGAVLFDGGSGPLFATAVWPHIRSRLSAIKLCVATHCGSQHIGGLLVLYRHLRSVRASNPRAYVPPLMIADYALVGDTESPLPRGVAPTEVALAVELAGIARDLGARREPESFAAIDAAFTLLCPREKATPKSASSWNPQGLVFEVYHRGTHSRVLLSGNGVAADIAEAIERRKNATSSTCVPESQSFDLIQVPQGQRAATDSSIVVLPATKCYINSGCGPELSMLRAYNDFNSEVLLYSLVRGDATAAVVPEDQCTTADETAITFTFHGSGLCESGFVPARAPPIPFLELRRSGLSPRKLHTPRNSLSPSPRGRPARGMIAAGKRPPPKEKGRVIHHQKSVTPKAEVPAAST